MRRLQKNVVWNCGLGLVLGFLCITPSFAGVGTSLMQTAPVLAPEEFETKLQADIIFNRGGGLNLSPRFRTGLIEDFLDGEVFVASGKTNFQAGALVKYNLLPDIDGQVGLSFTGGASYLRDDFNKKNYNILLVQLGVLVSKSFAVDFGNIAPYAAFQFESLLSSYDSYVPLTIIGGAKWEPTDLGPWSFYSEFGISIKDSLNMLGLGASYKF